MYDQVIFSKHRCFQICFYSLSLCIIICATNAARILGIVSIKAKSHFYLNQAVFSSLVSAGHRVTLISPFSTQNSTENFTIINLSERGKENDNPFASVAIKSIDIWTLFLQIIDVIAGDCEKVLQMPFIQVGTSIQNKRFLYF